MSDPISLVNKAIYYFDWYLLHGDNADLVAASNFMRDYRKLGGDLYQETEKGIQKRIAALDLIELEN